MMTLMESGKDSEVIAQVLAGDVNAFETLIDRYRARVFSIVANHVPSAEAGEVAHDIFVDVFRSLKSYAGRKPFEHWVSSIAVRRCCDYWRKRHRRHDAPVSSLSPEGCEWVERVMGENALEEHRQREAAGAARELLNYVLAKLPPKDRMALALIHLEGRSVSETAELLGWSAVNVKVRAYRARRELKKMIEEISGKRGEI